MALYESVFIVRQDVTSAQVEGLTEHFAGIIAAQGGNVTKKEPWGLRSLAYKIKKNRKGHYVLLNIDAPPAALQEMERNMRIHEDVLRYLSVRVEALEEGPSSILVNKGRDREGRDRDFRDGPRRDREGRDRDDRLRPTREPVSEPAEGNE